MVVSHYLTQLSPGNNIAVILASFSPLFPPLYEKNKERSVCPKSKKEKMSAL